MEANNWISLIVGIIVLALGGLPLLNQFAGISFGAFLVGYQAILFSWVLAIVGLYVVIDAFMEGGEVLTWITAIIGFLILTVGALNALASVGITLLTLAFIPTVVYWVLLVVEAILLIIAGFAAE